MVKIGTSGYRYAGWKGAFYPEGLSEKEELAYYAQRFQTVEVNFTYYRMPNARTIESMVRRTPEGFTFWVKANEATTHQQDPATAAPFNEALAPARAAGRLAGILFQFPYSFRNTERNRAYLARLPEDFPHDPLVVEFRNAGWANDAVFNYLRERRIGFCCVDEPSLTGLMPRIAIATSPVAYVRFHSRDASKWYESGGKERYNYLYKREELEEWVPKVQQLSEQTENVYIFFNNCHAGHAAVNAQEFKQLLAEIGIIG
jgi:uncharacterized protein YecE (DUF72 family)